MSSENKSAPYCSQDYREVQAYDDMTAETYTALLYIKSLTSIMETIIFTTATEVGAVVLLDYRRNKLRRGKHFSHAMWARPGFKQGSPDTQSVWTLQ